jgi:hypothetical protein
MPLARTDAFLALAAMLASMLAWTPGGATGAAALGAPVRISAPPASEDGAWRCFGQAAPDLSQVTENEPHAASNPSDRRNIVAAWQAQTKSGRAILTSASRDGGASWSPPRALPVNACASGPDPALPRTSDPFVAFGADNRA